MPLALPASQKKAGEPTTLYSKGRILGYKRSKVNQYETKSIIKIEHVNDKSDVDFCETQLDRTAVDYASRPSHHSGLTLFLPRRIADLGKRVVYVYRAKKIGKLQPESPLWSKHARSWPGSLYVWPGGAVAR